MMSQSLLHVNMSGSSYGQYVRSLYVQKNRPIILRQRSNSLPPGLALMNAEEADIMFSAAERATARRRKMVSVDHTLSKTRLDGPDNSSISNTTIKSSLLRQVTAIHASINKPLPPEPPKNCTQEEISPMENNSVYNKSVPPAITLPESILQPIPVTPLSSPRRQVASRSLKSYADGLFEFTQHRLTSTIPQLRIDPPQVSPDGIFEESSEPRVLASVVSPQPPRPFLQSRFSDWSVTTGANAESRRTSLAYTPIDLDSDMMSPNSFFSDSKDTVNQMEFNRLSGVSFASSETYEPPSTLPPPTPLGQTPALDGKEEISYFSNFDVYLHQESPQRDWPLVEDGLAENVIIDLSPMELDESPQLPPPRRQRERANTVIRGPVRSDPPMQVSVSPYTAYTTPETPLQLAEVAVRVPNWLIGAIG
jgi:hypothetical protein